MWKYTVCMETNNPVIDVKREKRKSERFCQTICQLAVWTGCPLTLCAVKVNQTDIFLFTSDAIIHGNITTILLPSLGINVFRRFFLFEETTPVSDWWSEKVRPCLMITTTVFLYYGSVCLKNTDLSIALGIRYAERLKRDSSFHCLETLLFWGVLILFNQLILTWVNKGTYNLALHTWKEEGKYGA